MPLEPAFNITSIDMNELHNAKTLLKHRFPQMVDDYLEDAAIYMATIQDGIDTADYEKIAKSAHPLKSSSAGLGLSAVSATAQLIENAAKERISLAEITLSLGYLKNALTHAGCILKSLNS